MLCTFRSLIDRTQRIWLRRVDNKGRIEMSYEESYIKERLDYLDIVAGVCQEIGLAAWLGAQEPSNRRQVSVGTATVAMILNGLGFSGDR